MNPIWINKVDSTNSEALRRLPSLPSGTVLAAREQTAGRGQRGNTWFSEPGKNLTFSVVLKSLDLPAAEAFRLNCLCSVAVSDFLASYGVSSSVKWPNDIYVAGRKICGMLLENGLADGSVAYSVMGIGINVNQTEFPQLANATSMVLAARPEEATPSVAKKKADAPSGAPPSRLTAELDLVHCLDVFLGKLQALLPQLRSAELFEEYERRLYRLGTSARYHDMLEDVDFDGIIRGVDPDGRLRIEDASGEIRRYYFKEVSYIL
ncbi:MAG: biotin--[Bacteroidales bacterium]|nr:biotin--[acetyl-CoA-carboxylase] ligase [Bacteroidales bacterium]